MTLLFVGSIGSAILWSSSTTNSTPFWMPRTSIIGSCPAATGPQPLAEDEFSEDGCGGGAVASHVTRLRRGSLHDAPMFSNGSQLDVFGTVTPSLVTWGSPALIEDGVAAARPEGAADGPGEFAGPSEKFLSRVVSVRELLGCHEFFLSRRLCGTAMRGDRSGASSNSCAREGSGY